MQVRWPQDLGRTGSICRSRSSFSRTDPDLQLSPGYDRGPAVALPTLPGRLRNRHYGGVGWGRAQGRSGRATEKLLGRVSPSRLVLLPAITSPRPQDPLLIRGEVDLGRDLTLWSLPWSRGCGENKEMKGQSAH